MYLYIDTAYSPHLITRLWACSRNGKIYGKYIFSDYTFGYSGQCIHYEQRCSILLQTSCVSGDRANSNLFPWLENATCAEPWLHRWRSRLFFILHILWQKRHTFGIFLLCLYLFVIYIKLSSRKGEGRVPAISFNL